MRAAGYLEHPQIIYERLAENEGGAGGFYCGVKKAFEEGFDWIWVMDDDAEPEPNSLELLMSSPEEMQRYSGICGMKMGLDGFPQMVHRGHFYPKIGNVPIAPEKLEEEQEIDYASFVGLLINSKAVASAGLPLAKFFIWFDDLEYCQRLIKFGPILYKPLSKILHKDGVNNKNKAEMALIFESPLAIQHQWKYLCAFRNHLYLMTHHGGRGYCWAAYSVFRKVLSLLIKNEHRWVLIGPYLNYGLQALGLKEFNTIKPDLWRSHISGR